MKTFRHSTSASGSSTGTGQSLQQRRDSNRGFHPRKSRAETVVDAVTECEVLVRTAGEIKVDLRLETQPHHGLLLHKVASAKLGHGHIDD